MKIGMKQILMLAVVLAASNVWSQQGEEERSSLFLYGISLSSDYDDQLANDPGGTGDFIYSVRPHIGFTLSRARWSTSINYLPTFTYSIQRTSDYDVLAHSVGLTFARRFTKRLSLDVQSTFTLTSNPFDSIRANLELEQPDVLDRPNSTLIATNRSRRMGQVVGTLTQALSARSSFGISGNFMHLEYRDGSTVSTGLLHRSLSGSANIFYQHKIRKRSSMEIRYGFEKFDFDRGSVRTDSHTLMYVWNFAPVPAVKISAFAGPNYSMTIQESVLPAASMRANQFSPVGGATVSWTGKRTVLSGTATQQISDGGGVGGTVRLESFSFEASQQLSRKVTIRGFSTYNRNHVLISVGGTPGTLNYLAAGAGLSHMLTEHTSIGASYWRIQQKQTALPGPYDSWNRVGITLSYEGQRPLGR